MAAQPPDFLSLSHPSAATAKADNRTTVVSRLQAKGISVVTKIQVMDTGVLAGTAPLAQPWITGTACCTCWGTPAAGGAVV